MVIGQNDHSRLAGQLAAHWGNSAFARAEPYESVVRAVVFHDCSWLRYETSPEIDTTTGEPCPFLKPLSGDQMASYQWSVDWMAKIDPYAALIISTHRTGLWQRRYGVMQHPGGSHLAKPTPAIQQFIDRNETWQKEQKAEIGDGNFWTNYRLLQVWDLLALYFCCQDPHDDYIEPVPVDYCSHAGGARMAMRALGNDKVAFDPFPFDLRPCRVQLTYKSLPRQTYPDTATFRRDYFRAVNGMIERPGHHVDDCGEPTSGTALRDP